MARLVVRIAIDAMGGDHAPVSEVRGAVLAARSWAIDVVLVGDEIRIRAELTRLGAERHPHISVVHASQAVTMSDPPGQVFRQKRDSSLRVAFELAAQNQVQAVVSAGNSGAILSHALFVLGRLPGLERPAILTELPTETGTLVLCDAGANTEVKPAMLAQFAVLGSCYDSIEYGRDRPRVALLSNGTEPEKGTELTRAADPLLRHASDDPMARFRYVGYIEASHLFDGSIDVVATDGYTGNIVLKLAEGLADAMVRMVHTRLSSTVRGRIGGVLLRPLLRDLKQQVDYAETGGALLAGVREVVTICHGRSDAIAIKNAIKQAARFVRCDLVSRLGEAIARHAQAWQDESGSAARA
ncbi:MAG: phosphate acyltransferase PlsX [Proteobacteria bacterium]|nr:phosphate acyltransferase PlsX [Pseudomonadota bacterium]